VFDAGLQKGYYHRNVNFQSYVDHAHDKFVSGESVCIDPLQLAKPFMKIPPMQQICLLRAANCHQDQTLAVM